ncbi:MAG: hypothetical protein ACFBSG_00175 [Leptolyngbyaceae cyanobacterium]
MYPVSDFAAARLRPNVAILRRESSQPLSPGADSRLPTVGARAQITQGLPVGSAALPMISLRCLGCRIERDMGNVD